MSVRAETASAIVPLASGPLTALFLGDPQRADFAPAIGWLRRRTELVCGLDREACLPADAASPPEWVVVGQSREGEFSPREIAELRRRWPLARLVVVAGSWSEGEQAKQKVSLGAWRMAWHQFVPRAAEQWRARAAGRPGPWDRPLTLADDERHDARPPELAGLRVAIVSQGKEEAAALAECLAALGADCRREWPAVGGADAAIWIESCAATTGDDRIARACRVDGCRAVIALTAFPRAADWPRLLADPRGAVLGLPASASDLASLLRELTT